MHTPPEARESTLSFLFLCCYKALSFLSHPQELYFTVKGNQRTEWCKTIQLTVITEEWERDRNWKWDTSQGSTRERMLICNSYLEWWINQSSVICLKYKLNRSFEQFLTFSWSFPKLYLGKNSPKNENSSHHHVCLNVLYDFDGTQKRFMRIF